MCRNEGPEIPRVDQNFKELTRQSAEDNFSDLMLVNTINKVANSGSSFPATLEAVGKLLKRRYQGNGATVFLLDDRGQLVMQNMAIASHAVARLEKLLGWQIANVKFLPETVPFYLKLIKSQESSISSEEKQISQWILDMALATLPQKITRSNNIMTMIPSIMNIVKIVSIMAAPLISEGEVIGVIQVSSDRPLNPDDLPSLRIIAEELATTLMRITLQASLTRSEANLAESQRIANLGSWELNLVDDHLFWSDEVYRIFDVDKNIGPLNYQTFLSLVLSEDREKVDAAFISAVENQAPYDVTHRLLLPEDKLKYVRELGETIYDDEGHPSKFVGTVQDITEQHQQRLMLTKLSEAVKQTADYVIITALSGIIEYVNLAFTKQTGYSSDEVIGRTPRILKSGKHSEEFYGEVWDTITKGIPFSGVFTNKKKSGELYYESKTITPVWNEQNEITHYVSTGKDITYRRKVEERLLKKEKILQKNIRLLEQKNIGMKELTLELSRERRRIEEHIQLNIQNLIIPDLDRLKIAVGEEGNMYIRLLEENLSNITSSFGRMVTTELLSLSTKEIEICKMIRGGMTSKEIAIVMKISYRTVEVHRYNIRKKLKIHKSQINLATYLNSMSTVTT